MKDDKIEVNDPADWTIPIWVTFIILLVVFVTLVTLYALPHIDAWVSGQEFGI